MRKLIPLLSFSQYTPLHLSALYGDLEVIRLLVESKADVAARTRCLVTASHHLSLTICLAAVVGLHSNAPSSTTKPTLLHTCAASALLNDAPPRAAAAQIKALLVLVSPLLFEGVGGGGGGGLKWAQNHPRRVLF